MLAVLFKNPSFKMLWMAVLPIEFSIPSLSYNHAVKDIEINIVDHNNIKDQFWKHRLHDLDVGAKYCHTITLG